MSASITLTFKEMQDLALDQLQELQGATDFTLIKLKKYLNLGYTDFVRRVKPISDSYDITTVANQVSYSIYAARFFGVSHARYIADSSTEYGIPLKLWPGGYANLPRFKEFGEPSFIWARYGGDNTAAEVGTVPIISTADVTLRVLGYNLPDPLSNDSAIPVIHEAYHEAPILWAIWKIGNAYAHKSKAIREKSLTARNEYLELVKDSLMDASAFTLDDISTVDEYDTWNYD